MPDNSTLTGDVSFEKALTRLEGLVDQLESDDLTMEEALRAYERGVAMADRCQEHLDAAEVRIEELTDSA